MTVPEVYPTTGGEAIASYDYFDIAGGTGVKRFYAGSASGAFILSTNQFYGQPFEKSYSTGGAFPTLISSFNFDAEFNLNQRIKGMAICSAPIEVASGVQTGTGMVIFSLQKISNNVTTHIASGASAHVVVTGTKEEACTASLDCPLTQLKKDDTLRLKVEFFGGVDAGSTNLFLAFDPKNRAGTTITTIDTNLVADIPFRIETS